MYTLGELSSQTGFIPPWKKRACAEGNSSMGDVRQMPILVVEDNVDDSFLLTRQLARADLDDCVTVLGNGQDALDWLIPRASGIDRNWTLAITEKDDVHIGVVAIELRHGRWNLAYWLNRYYWRRGIMGEAVSAALERFGRRMPETSVHSGVFVDNPASLKLQEKLGFRITGCTEVYSFARNTMVPHIETVLSPGTLPISRVA